MHAGPSSASETWMRLALEQAQAAGKLGEVPVGAVVVREGVLLAVGHNRTILDQDPSAHAEIMALRLAARKVGNHRLVGAELWVTLEPCAMCAGAIVQARIAKVSFGALDPRAGAVESNFRIFNATCLNHRPLWTGGELAQASSALLRDFFRTRRPSPLT